MNKDLLFAASVSVLAHAGLVWIGQAFRHPTLVAMASPTEKPIVFTLPPAEPEPPDVTYDPVVCMPSRPQAPSYTSLPDQISAVPSPFVVPVEPRPPGIDVDRVDILPHVDGPSGPGGPGGIGHIFALSALSHQPEATVKVPPQYPFELRREGIGGQALVEFIVDAKGNVLGASPVEGGQHPEFDAAAVEAVRKWHFRPGIKDGRPVATRMQVPIVFSLSAD